MPFGRTASWDQSAFDRDSARNEKSVRRGFWGKVKRTAGKLPFVEDLLAAYYCAFDHATPLHAKAALMGALAYFVLPADAMPDVLPLLGYTDDAAVLITALRIVGAHIGPQHREAARTALARGLNN
jgi:uncharacterized membrane protein YkvA (DUF1232 family)